MHNLLYVIKTLYKRKWFLLIVPLVIAIIVYILLSSQPKTYKSSTTVYTGIVSGYDVFSSSAGAQDWMSVNNAVDNLVNIVKAESTLEEVSLQLLARNLSHLNTQADNEYLTAFSSLELMGQIPADIFELVVTGDEAQTYTHLREYYEASNDNHLKQMFHWNHRHYSFKALSKIEVERIGNSDMIKISYVNDDQYIVYNTLLLVVDAFIDQYMKIRYEQTNDVVAYFENELKIIRSDLTSMENALTDYNVSRGIINYEEQTRMVAEHDRDLDDKIENVMSEYAGASEKVRMLEEKIGQSAQVYYNNAAFVEQLHNISSLYNKSSGDDGEDTERAEIEEQISGETTKLRKLILDMISTKYSKEGIASEDLVTEWLNALITQTRSKEELEVLQNSKKKLSQEFKRFSPVGSSIKRQNREIEFCEQNYLSNLQGLNEAKLRQKNLQLTSATFRILTPPTVALSPEKTKNKFYSAIAFALVLAILITYVILAEIFNRKPYDKQAAEKIIGIPVMGALHELGGTGTLAMQCDALVYNQLGNAVLNFLDRSKMTNIINVISMDSGEGKTTLCTSLTEHFKRIDTKPVYISAGKDFEMDDKYYLMASSIYDFGINENNAEALAEANVVILEYPPISTSSFPVKLLDSAALTILVVDSRKAWKDMSRLVMRQIRLNDKDNKIRVVINRTDKDTVGTFTGMLPPYTLRHRIHYTMWNLGNNTDDGRRS